MAQQVLIRASAAPKNHRLVAAGAAARALCAAVNDSDKGPFSGKSFPGPCSCQEMFVKSIISHQPRLRAAEPTALLPLLLVALPPLRSTSLLLASSLGQERNLLRPPRALCSPLCCGADLHPHSARVLSQRSPGNYTPLRKKHFCKGNSFPFPSPAWPQPSRAFWKKQN